MATQTATAKPKRAKRTKRNQHRCPNTSKRRWNNSNTSNYPQETEADLTRAFRYN